METVNHIILNCTNRKRVGVGPYPCLRDLPRLDIQTRAAAWIERIGAAGRDRLGRDLYAGEYWQSGLALASTASTYGRAEVWILSAGLGLVHADDMLPAYGATLAAGHPDSVDVGGPGARAVRHAWWEALANWSGPSVIERPRRLADLAATTDARLLVCAGPAYLDAVAEDLIGARKVLGNDRLIVIGASELPLELSEASVRVPGQLRLRFGGSMSSVGPRAARAIVDELLPNGSLRPQRARELVASWVATTDALPRYEGKRLSDKEVEAWIIADARNHPGAANKSSALRRLREEGRACEQSRFGRQYDRVVWPSA